MTEPTVGTQGDDSVGATDLGHGADAHGVDSGQPELFPPPSKRRPNMKSAKPASTRGP